MNNDAPDLMLCDENGQNLSSDSVNNHEGDSVASMPPSHYDECSAVIGKKLTFSIFVEYALMRLAMLCIPLVVISGIAAIFWYMAAAVSAAIFIACIVLFGLGIITSVFNRRAYKNTFVRTELEKYIQNLQISDSIVYLKKDDALVDELNLTENQWNRGYYDDLISGFYQDCQFQFFEINLSIESSSNNSSSADHVFNGHVFQIILPEKVSFKAEYQKNESAKGNAFDDLFVVKFESDLNDEDLLSFRNKIETPRFILMMNELLKLLAALNWRIVIEGDKLSLCIKDSGNLFEYSKKLDETRATFTKEMQWFLGVLATLIKFDIHEL